MDMKKNGWYIVGVIVLIFILIAGYFVFSDNALMQSPPFKRLNPIGVITYAPIGCVDTDGLNFFNLGSVRLIYPEGTVLPADYTYSYDDYCTNTGGLIEYYCDATRPKVLTRTVDCTSLDQQERTCVDGACVLSFCQDECPAAGQTVCGDNLNLSNNQMFYCGNYDSDDCLEWSAPVVCSGGACENGACVSAGPTCVMPPAGLVSWWTGDERDFLTVIDSWDGNNGVASPSLHWNGQGKVGDTIVFDGQTQYVEVPDANSLDVTSITIEGWVKQSSFSNSQIILGKSGAYHFGVGGQYPGEVGCVIFTQEGYLEIEDSGTNRLSIGEWNHVACTYDATASQMKTYINGVMVKMVELSNTSENIVSNNNYVTIGNWENAYFFNGSIDELSIYNRALTDAEILGIYNADNAGKCNCALYTSSIEEGITQQLVVGDTSYEVNVNFVGPSSVKFIVNGELTDFLQAGQTYLLNDGTSRIVLNGVAYREDMTAVVGFTIANC